MFSFPGRTDRTRFLIGAGIRIAFFIASVFAFPFMLYGIALASNCGLVGGACGAVALIASMALKPLFFTAFVFSFVGLSVRRVRDAGFPAVLGLAIPLLMAADYRFGIFTGAHWSFAFSAGALFLRPPIFLAMALCAMLVLALLPSREPVIATPAGNGTPTPQTPQSPAARLMAAFPPLPPWIVLVGAILAAIAVIATQRTPTNGAIALAANLVPIGLPTWVMYTALVWGIWCVVQRRNHVAFAILAAAALPFVLWGYATISATMYRQREAAAINSMKTVRLARVPHVLVVSARRSNGFYLFGHHGITEVISVGADNAHGDMLSYKGGHDGGMLKLDKVTTLPDEYLSLMVGRESRLVDDRRRYMIGGGPLELRYIAPARDELVGAWYKTVRWQPVIPPVLTFWGWLPQRDRGTTSTVMQNIISFFDRSIASATALESPVRSGHGS
jgi:uncharacterized membrane protein YhaH (DUF805 family)